MDRQLPARAKTKQSVSVLLYCYFVLAYITLLIGAGAYTALMGLAYQEFWLCGLGTIIVLVGLWSTGSFYITVPLSLAFNRGYRTERDYAKVAAVHTKALRILGRLPVKKNVDVATTMSNLGLMRMCEGYYESAEEMFQEAAEFLDKHKHLSKSVSAIVVHNNIGAVQIRLGKYIEAELEGTKALELAQLPKNQKKFAIMSGPPLCVIGAARLRLGELDSAEEYFQKARAIYESAPLPMVILPASKDQGQAQCYAGLAMTYIKQGKISDSEFFCDKMLDMVKRDLNIVNTLGLEGLNLLSNEYMNNKLFERAETLLKIAYVIGHEHSYHPDAKQTLKYFEKLLLITDRQPEVDDMRRWLRDIELSPIAKIEGGAASLSRLKSYAYGEAPRVVLGRFSRNR